mgnify:FL=1
MVQIQYLGQFLDIKENEKVTYTIQVQDLADVSSVASSVTTSFKLPKTKNNYEALKSLSLPGDTSNLPYLKNVCKLYNFGTTLIDNGWLKINNSDEESFNVNVENGIIDFFKAIEGKTIGNDLDLSDTNHNKDLITVINSFERNDYTYIIADYNGLNTYLKGGVNYINVDYLVPTLNSKYIWDKIFNSIGYTYSGSIFNSESFTNLWVTYPKAPPTKSDDEQLPDPVLRFSSNKTNNIVYTEDYDNLIIEFDLENIVLNEVLFNSNKITIQSTGTYSLDSIFYGYADYIVDDNWGYPVGSERSYFRPALLINGVLNKYNSQINSVNLRSGDVVEIICHWYDIDGGYINGIRELKFDSYNIKLTQISQSIIDFGKEFLDISIAEYVKEIMMRFALTPFIDVESKHIKFLTLSERINTNNVKDWTDKFVKRTDENYIYKDYAQRNWLKHKYNDENATFNNGFLSVSNQTLQPQKDLYSSKFYSFNNEITSFYDSDFTNNSFPIWNREIKETINNDTTPPTKTYDVNYKGLSNRFYFIRRKILPKTINIGSQLLRIEETANNVAIVDTKNLSYSDAVNNYKDFVKVLNDTRIHEIELFLNINDLLDLDLESLYYFSQENQYYILNRITIDLTNNINKAEFIRVKYN